MVIHFISRTAIAQYTVRNCLSCKQTAVRETSDVINAFGVSALGIRRAGFHAFGNTKQTRNINGRTVYRIRAVNYISSSLA